MIKREISSFEVAYQIKNFLHQHSKDYTQEEQQFIIANSCWGKKTSLVPDMLRQIYDELNLLEPRNNIYLGFIELLTEAFPDVKDFTEIGGGRLPRLGTHLALKFQTGNVTVYDPRLFEEATKIENLCLKKEYFTKEHSVSKAGMMIGFMPCTATELLIETACKNNLDFMIALCDGEGDLLYNNELDDFEYDWQSRIIYDARRKVREYQIGSLEVTDLEQYDDPYPVIYNKRK